MIARITTLAARREEMIGILEQSATGMPGCLSYVVAKDAEAADVLWVTEVWQSPQDHDSSLSLRQVQEAIPRARPLIVNFERVAVTTPVWGAGLTG
jgi:quinol monooxygenase YgiN